jgi:L-fucose isomerase-like protein
LNNGGNDIMGTIAPDTNNAYDFGTSSLKFATIYATSFSGNASTANYADLAERFAADAEYSPGTVVALGGAEEITRVAEEGSESVFGVISTRPAYLMNAGAGANDTHPPVAMSGRVPVLVVGQVRKGDRLISAGNGLAKSAKAGEITAFNVIGRALEDKYNEGEGSIEAFVKIN